MDFTDFSTELDPTLPLNEASVLPPFTPTHKKNGKEDIWSKYRSDDFKTVTPATNDAMSDCEDGDFIRKGVNVMDRSLVSTMIDRRRGLGAGYTLKQVEEELTRMRKENFDLRLRIRLLEENQGIAIFKPEDKENIFRINLDLRVEKEKLGKEIDEKNKLLEDAYVALSSLEEEKQRDKELYEEEIQRLIKASEEKETEGKKCEELLLDAFGSMNLGAHLEDDGPPQSPEVGIIHQAERHQSVGQRLSGNLKKFGAQLERVGRLEAELEKEKELVDKLSTENGQLRKDLESAERQLHEKKEEVERLTTDVELKSRQVDSYEKNLTEKCSLSEKNSALEAELDKLQKELENKSSEISNLEELARNLEKNLMLGDEAHKESQAESISRLAAMRQEIQTLKDELKKKGKEIESLSTSLERKDDKISILQTELDAAKVELNKAQLCIEGLVDNNKTLSKDLEKRKRALEILTEQYEIAKTKIRKYREDKSYLSNKENIDTTNMTTASTVGNVAHVMAENEMLKKKKLSLEKELYKLQEKGFNHPTLTPSTNVDESELLNKVRQEMSTMKREFVRLGVDKAVSKAKELYTKEMRHLESTHNCVINLMRKRLEELADFLETLLSNGNLDVSLLSNQLRNSIHRSLNESRRLSMSFAMNASRAAMDASNLENISETGELEIADDVPAFRVPELNFKFSDDELEIDSGNEDGGSSLDKMAATIVSGFKENSAERHELEARLKELEAKVAETEEVRDSVRELQEELRYKTQLIEKKEVELEGNDRKLAEKDEEIIRIKSKLVETSSTLDGLRVRHGKVKEWLAEKTRQYDELEEKSRHRVESLKEVSRLKNELAKCQVKYEDVLQNYNRISSESRSEIESLREQLQLATGQENSELERLRRELKEALDKLAEYRARQERLEKAIRPQLAKTHQVLKKAQSNLDDAQRGQPL